MRFIERTAVRLLAGAGLIGATALGLSAPAAAEEEPLEFTLGVMENAGYPGDTVEAYAYLQNLGGSAIIGYSIDLTVPDGATITGIVDGEILDGTERPDEGCALATPQRLVCHTAATLRGGEDVESWFEVTIDDDAPLGVLGPIRYTVTPDDGEAQTGEADLTVVAPAEVEIFATLGPDFDVSAPPGAAFDQVLEVTNLGGDMVGSSIDFDMVEDVTLTGITGLDLVDGTTRPDEGCVVVGARVECHTNATLAQGATSEVTFHLRMPETAEHSNLGDAEVRVVGDNGGEASDTQTVFLDVDLRVLEVTATPSVTGSPGEVVEVVVDVKNRGPVGVKVRIATLAVPEGATVVGTEGCDVLTPREIECERTDLLLAGDDEEWTFRVQLDDDAPAGELGTAALTFRGGDEFYEAETVLKVTGDGDELPDTGAGGTGVLFAALGLLFAGGAALAVRARRS